MAEAPAEGGGFSWWPVRAWCQRSPIQVCPGHFFWPSLSPLPVTDYACAGDSCHSWACCRGLSPSTRCESELLCGPAFPGSRIISPPKEKATSFSPVHLTMQAVYKNLRTPCESSYEWGLCRTSSWVLEKGTLREQEARPGSRRL